MTDVMIVDTKLPEPMREEPEIGTPVYMPNPGVFTGVDGFTAWEIPVDHVQRDTYSGTEADKALLKAGMLHDNVTAAFVHALAHISISGGELFNV